MKNTLQRYGYFAFLQEADGRKICYLAYFLLLFESFSCGDDKMQRAVNKNRSLYDDL